MLDFLLISARSTKRGTAEIYPRFIIKKSSDLLIRGGDFYAIWVEERGLWSTDEQDALQLIDRELDAFAAKYKEEHGPDVKVLHMWDSENGMIDRWHKYCQKHMRDDFVMLDEKLIFSNTETGKTDYASKRLPYPLENGDCAAWVQHPRGAPTGKARRGGQPQGTAADAPQGGERLHCPPPQLPPL